MPRKINRKAVQWEKANCMGMPTDWFYMQKAELMAQEGIFYVQLREICFRCPIWKDCLEVGATYERYGWWGGLSEEERSHLFRNLESRTIEYLKRDLRYLHMKFDEIKSMVQGVDQELIGGTDKWQR